MLVLEAFNPLLHIGVVALRRIPILPLRSIGAGLEGNKARETVDAIEV